MICATRPSAAAARALRASGVSGPASAVTHGSLAALPATAPLPATPLPAAALPLPFACGADRSLPRHPITSRTTHTALVGIGGPLQRQLEHEVRARGARVDRDHAVVIVDDLLDDREPEPGAALAAGREQLEQPSAQLRRNTRAAVLDRPHEHVVHLVDADGELAAFRHRLDRVSRE